MPSILNIIGARRAQQSVVDGKQGENIDVPHGSRVLITGCTGCTVNALGKSSNVTMERCADTVVRVGTVVASLEVIHCTSVEVSVLRCRTITVDASKKVTLLCALQRSPEAEEAAQEPQEGKDAELEATPPPVSTAGAAVAGTAATAASAGATAAAAVAEEAEAVRLFTSCSEEVSIAFAGVAIPVDGDNSPTRGSYVHQVPKDFVYEKGDGPRSLTRISVDRSSRSSCGSGFSSASCKTLRCDQYGTPLEEADAIKDGVSWTWEHGRSG